MSILYKTRLFVKNIYSSYSIFSRGILSQNYFCNDEWSKRLDQALFKNLNMESFFLQLKERFNKKIPVESIDIDIFVNSSETVIHLEECINFFTLFRKTRRTAYTLDSTHHALCRLFLRFNNLNECLDSIEKRLEFGLFPDLYCCNMMLDYAIENNDVKNAIRIVIYVMLQEMFQNRITNILSLHSLYKYLLDSKKYDMRPKIYEKEEKAAQEKTNTEEEEEEETLYLRVPFLRNPYFDDHFDITDPTHLFGKSLFLFGRSFNDILGRTSQIIGLAYYNKWQEANELLSQFRSIYSNDILLKSATNIISTVIESLKEKDKAKEFYDNLNALESLMCEIDITNLIKEKLMEIPKLEENDIKEIKQLYSDWNLEREILFKKHMDTLMRKEKIKEIVNLRKNFAQKEKHLYFFENFVKHEMAFVEAEKKIQEMKSETSLDSEYFPPQISEIQAQKR